MKIHKMCSGGTLEDMDDGNCRVLILFGRKCCRFLGSLALGQEKSCPYILSLRRKEDCDFFDALEEYTRPILDI